MSNPDEPARSSPTTPAQRLRQRAEERVRATEATDIEVRTPEQNGVLLHELRVYQIELEMQNEQLRHTQSELELSQARYYDLYDTAPVAYVTLNEQGVIQEANRTAAIMFGVAKESLVVQPLTHFIAAVDQNIYYHYRRRLVRLGTSQICELRMLRQDQASFWARIESTIIHNTDSGSAVHRMVINDISVRMQAEIALRELNETLEQRVIERTSALRASEQLLSQANADLANSLQVKDLFLATISHELRTPLTAVLGLAELFLDGIYGPLSEHQLEAMRRVEQSGQHLLKLINNILDLSKIIAGKLRLQIEETVLTMICQSALHLVAHAALRKQIAVQLQIDPQVVYINADPQRLVQILVNLLSNAIKFTPNGGAVGLEVYGNAEQELVTFVVWDTGIGIASDDLPLLFQPFVQIDGRLNRQYEGSGLGLVLVQRLIEAHGGSVAVTSTFGQGSRFSVVLPWKPRAEG
jgi:PAS domain S-box-containing protein